MHSRSRSLVQTTLPPRLTDLRIRNNFFEDYPKQVCLGPEVTFYNFLTFVLTNTAGFWSVCLNFKILRKGNI